MRLWSIHPKYLDSAGLVALWREALLARKVLEGRTVGYTYHPQLMRFRNTADPLVSINTYLKYIYDESVVRGFKFNQKKLSGYYNTSKINVSKGQINFEFNHLLRKLKSRDRNLYEELKYVKLIQINPLFNLVNGKIELWEKVQ